MTTRSIIQKERKTRNIPPVLAGVVSAIAPGLGHILIGYWERGIYLFISSISILGLIIWRTSVIAYRQETWSERFVVAFRRQPILYLFVALLLALIITAISSSFCFYSWVGKS